jgi:Phosphotransferase enzyme family
MRKNKEQSTLVIQSLGGILGEILCLVFDGYGSLKLQEESQSSVGPLVDPINSLHRDFTLTDAGPWPSSESSAFLLALATRELQWLTSDPGQRLFKQWRGSMYAEEDITKTLQIFTDLAQYLLLIIPKMYYLFPLRKEACRPALRHPDFHYSNVLVSHENPTIVVGVLDWEYASIVPLWAAYVVPHKLVDLGDKYEMDVEWREEKRRLRGVFRQACVSNCSDASIVIQPEDEAVQRSLRGLRILLDIATSGVALYNSCEKTKAQLVEMLQCVDANNSGGVETIKALVVLFS